MAAVALTGHPGASKLNISDKMLKAQREKHSDELDKWWKSEIGFGLDKLTQGEVGHRTLEQPQRLTKSEIESLRAVYLFYGIVHAASGGLRDPIELQWFIKHTIQGGGYASAFNK